MQRLESLHVIHTLEHAEEISLGSRTYELVKIAMGWKRFTLYMGFVMVFSFLCGMVVNLIL